MACPCTSIDVQAIADAYYRMGGAAQMSEVKLYMKPGVRSVSSGELGSFEPGDDNTVVVQKEVADYLLSALPDVFSTRPFKKQASTPAETSKE